MLEGVNILEASPTTAADIARQIRQFLADNFLADVENLRDDDSFLEQGIVDSTGVLELVMFVEETWDITVEDDEILPENFDSVAQLVRYVHRKRNGASPE